MTTYTKATIITGTDERGNELALRSYPEGWFDVYEERYIPTEVAQQRIGPNCVVRFGETAITGTRWQRMGSPLELETERIAELREPERPEAERQTAESDRDLEWLDIGEAVQVAYGEAVAIAAEVRARQEEGRKELLDLWELEARDAEAGTRFSVSGGEVEER